MNVKEIVCDLSEEEFIDVLDDIYGDVEICGMKYSSGRALLELDPIAFRCAQGDYEGEQDSSWQCGECLTEHNDEDEAEECCKPEETEDELKEAVK